MGLNRAFQMTDGFCLCEPGWTGDSCEVQTIVVATGCGITAWYASLVQLPVIGLGLVIGYAIKHTLEQRQRAKMRAILQQDAQRPFNSGGMS